MVRTGTKIQSIREIMGNMPKADLADIANVENAIKKARIKSNRTTLYKVRTELLGTTTKRKTAKRGSKPKRIVETFAIQNDMSHEDIMKYTLQLKSLTDKLTPKKVKSMIDTIVKMG